MNSRLAALLAIALAAFGALATPSAAEAPKCISIKLVVPSAVGTATDMVMRAYTETINRRSTGPLIKVINITKKSATMDGISAKPDGCTLLATTQRLVADYLANAENPEWSSFKPIALLTRTPLLVVARGNLKDANLANIIEQALQDPNTVGIGEARSNLERMLLMSLEDASGARFRIMTYDTGRQSFAALLSGQLDIGIISASGAKRRADQKELQVLAVTSEERSTLLPDVPTLKEQGIAGDFGIDRGLLAPKEIPEEIVTEISGWFKKASEDPALIDRLAGHGTQVYFRESDAFTQYFENLTADWLEMIERAIGQQIRRQPS